MLTGFNTNIRYRGVLFHVQSEDSGANYGHIITHLYHHGTILFSEKSSYSEHLEAPDLEDRVRRQMEEQHKRVLKKLVGAHFDELIQERLGEGALAPATDPKGETAPDPSPPPAPEASAPETGGQAPPGSSSGFGDGLVSEKPLDEVILSYLVENARKRKRRSG